MQRYDTFLPPPPLRRRWLPPALGVVLVLFPSFAVPAALAAQHRGEPAVDLSPVLQVWSHAAHVHAARCQRFNDASVTLWDKLEPIASDDVAWVPEALGLLEHYPGLSASQQAMHRALMHDACATTEPIAYELEACSPAAFVYGMRRILTHLSYLPGNEALRHNSTQLVLRKAMHDLAQPCPPLTLLGHLALLDELRQARLFQHRRTAGLLQAAHQEIAQALENLGLGYDTQERAEGLSSRQSGQAADALSPRGSQGPADELMQLDLGRKLLLQLVACELLP